MVLQVTTFSHSGLSSLLASIHDSIKKIKTIEIGLYTSTNILQYEIFYSTKSI